MCTSPTDLTAELLLARLVLGVRWIIGGRRREKGESVVILKMRA